MSAHFLPSPVSLNDLTKPHCTEGYLGSHLQLKISTLSSHSFMALLTVWASRAVTNQKAYSWLNRQPLGSPIPFQCSCLPRQWLWWKRNDSQLPTCHRLGIRICTAVKDVTAASIVVPDSYPVSGKAVVAQDLLFLVGAFSTDQSLWHSKYLSQLNKNSSDMCCNHISKCKDCNFW